MSKTVVWVVKNRVIGEGDYAHKQNRSDDGGIIATTASSPYKSRSFRNEDRTSSSEFDKKVLESMNIYFFIQLPGTLLKKYIIQQVL